MNARDEGLMLDGIASWRKDQPLVSRPRRDPPPYIADDWQDKYDELYRELKPREWFGKIFSSQYRKAS